MKGSEIKRQVPLPVHVYKSWTLYWETHVQGIGGFSALCVHSKKKHVGVCFKFEAKKTLFFIRHAEYFKEDLSCGLTSIKYV